jgi:hypothetical protein
MIFATNFLGIMEKKRAKMGDILKNDKVSIPYFDIHLAKLEEIFPLVLCPPY